MIPAAFPEHIDPVELANSIWFNRDDLRRLPESIVAAAAVAQHMVRLRDSGDTPDWCTEAALEGVIGCIAGAASRVYGCITEIMGAYDGDDAVTLYVGRQTAERLRNAVPECETLDDYLERLIPESDGRSAQG